MLLTTEVLRGDAKTAVILSIQEKLAALREWIKQAEEELNKPEQPTLPQILYEYCNIQHKGAENFSYYGWQKANITTLKDVTNSIVYLNEGHQYP